MGLTVYIMYCVMVKVLFNNPTPHNSNHGGTEIT